ncbi:unnamed protein product [Mytilus coruscus]|uniref:DZIP3-like HEPN domain-containing protein n=1 Tax=Mytilus coruscus TaxID=42192 RepID=A0A6J8ECC3_MYTCO|nr:unnamed protein product [Mytilus coruscus]
MATAKLQTKESRTRLARILLVVSDVFPEIMQELLLDSIPPRTLFNMIQNDRKMSDNLNSKEQKIVQDMYQRGYADVDVTFAYKLLKYFNLIPTPTQSWGREPRSRDLSVSDDVERIHHFRNSVCHRASKEVSEKEFQKYFTDFIEIGKRLDTYLQKNSTFGFSTKVLSLRTNSIDAETEEKYTNALEEICELKLQLRHKLKNDKTLNIYYGIDFESMIQETNEKGGEDEGEVAATIVIHGCDNEEEITEKINNLKENLNTGRYTIKLNSASHGSILLYVSIQTKMLKYRKSFMAEVTGFMEDILGISTVDCDVTATLRLFDFILDKDGCTKSSTRQDEWPSTYVMQPGIQKKPIRLDVGIKIKTLESSTCLHENVIGFVTNVLETGNENVISQEQHVIDVILQGEHTDFHRKGNIYKPCDDCSNVQPQISTYGCSTCRKFFCHRCFDIHTEFNIHHKVFRNIDVYPLACLIHQNEYISSFCSYHDQLCCSACVCKFHPKCKTVDICECKSLNSSFEADLQQRLQDAKDVQVDIVERLSENDSHLTANHQQISSRIHEIKEILNQRLCDLEIEAEEKLSEIVNDNKSLSNELLSRNSTLKQFDLDIEFNKSINWNEGGHTFVLFKLIEKHLANEEIYLDSVRNKLQVSNINLQDGNIDSELSAFGQISVVQEKVTLPSLRKVKQSQVPILRQRSSIAISLISKFIASDFNDRARISAGRFLLDGKFLLKDSVYNCLYICQDDGSFHEQINLENWPADITVVNENLVAVALWENGMQIVDVNTLEVKPIREIGFVSSLASYKEMLVIVLDGHIVRTDLNGNIIKVLDRTCAAISISVDQEGTIYYTDETNIYCIDWNGGSIFKRKLKYLDPENMCVNKYGEMFALNTTKNGVYKLSKSLKQYEVILGQENDIKQPRGLAYNDNDDRLMVINADGASVDIFQLK